MSVFLFSCKKPPAVNAPPPAAAVLNSNNVGENPSPLLQELADANIKWKQLTQSTVDYARESDKLILIFACSSTYAEDVKKIAQIDGIPALVEQIGKEFVPVFVDIDACSEVGIISAILSDETKKPVSFPFVILMHPNGNPISAVSLSVFGTEGVVKTYREWMSVVYDFVKDSKEYLLTNSRNDALQRNERYKPVYSKSDLAPERQAVLTASLSKLHSYFEDSLAILNTGSQLPVHYLDIMRASAQIPSLPPAVRKKSHDIFLSSLRMLLDSTAVDFIDGGFYFYRRNPTWAHTGPDRNAISQADMVCLLAEAYQLSQDDSYRETAMRTMDFLQEFYGLSDGTFRTHNPMAYTADEQRLWTMEDLQASLDEGELQLLKNYCGLSALGNLPYESDPKRVYFRKNTLTPRMTIANAAAACSLTELRAEELLVSIRTKLSKKRQMASSETVKEAVPDARATLRAAGAAAALYRITGKEKWKDLAHNTMLALRKTFHSDQVPSFYPASAYPATSDARAGLLAQMAKAALDFYHISGEHTWLEYANSLTNIIEASYLNEFGIEESPASARLMNVASYSQQMLYDVSTIGILRQNLIRMEQYGLPRNEKLYAACQINTDAIKMRPTVYTDYLMSILYQDFSMNISLNDPKNPEFLSAYRLSSPGLLRIDPKPAQANVGITLNQPDIPINEATQFKQFLRP